MAVHHDDISEHDEEWKAANERFQMLSIQYLEHWKSLRHQECNTGTCECCAKKGALFVPASYLPPMVDDEKSRPVDDDAAYQGDCDDGEDCSSQSSGSTIVKFDVSFLDEEEEPTGSGLVSKQTELEKSPRKEDSSDEGTASELLTDAERIENNHPSEDSSDEAEWINDEQSFDFQESIGPPSTGLSSSSQADDPSTQTGDSLNYNKSRITKSTTTKSSFSSYREELAEDLFVYFNSEVFNGFLSDSTEIAWSTSLRSTAGLTRCTTSNPRSARIELGTKVLDCEQRLRDTLFHEMCHAATFIIDRVEKPGHGELFWKWAKRGEQLLESIKVSTRHDYVIDYKYTWQCECCGAQIHRHNKRGFDPDRKVCGLDGGTFLQIKPKPRKPSAYNVFVQKNHDPVRTELERRHGKPTEAEVFKECARRWRKLKDGKK